MESPRASGPSHHCLAGNPRAKGPAEGLIVTHGQRSGSRMSVLIPSPSPLPWKPTGLGMDGYSLSDNWGPAILQLMLQWGVSCDLPEFLSLPLTFKLKCVLEEKEVSECDAGTSFLNKSFCLHHRVIANKLFSCNVSKTFNFPSLHWLYLCSLRSSWEMQWIVAFQSSK